MSTDARITKQIMKTLQNGREGYAKGAEKLDASDASQLATTFRHFSEQRATFYDELAEMARDYGDDLEESGTVAGALHRGWMAVKDMMAGSDPEGVLDAAEQGEDHAVNEYDDALQADLSTELRTVLARQRMGVKAAHDEVRGLRDAYAN